MQSRTQVIQQTRQRREEEAKEPNPKSVWWAHSWDKASVRSRSALGTYRLLWSSSEGSQFCPEINRAEPLAAAAFLKWSDIEGSVSEKESQLAAKILFLKGLNQSWALQTSSASACYQFWGMVSWCWSGRYLVATVPLTAGVVAWHRPLLDMRDSILLSTATNVNSPQWL